MAKIKLLSKINWFYILFGVLFLILLVNRSFPYISYGPFGFGYDTGIYKKTFEEIKNFSDIFSSAVDIFPSFLAYVSNKLNLPIFWLLYYFHILISAFIAIPLYLLTKEYFGKYAGIAVIAIFTVSYVQVLASEFYLYKAVLGSFLMLFAFYFYSKKSYKFYIFAFLLALTQLPQLLLLCFGIGIATIVGGKKDFKFNLIGFFTLLIALGILLIFKAEYLFGAVNVVLSSLNVQNTMNSHQTGLFMTLPAYLHRSYIILGCGIMGFILSIKQWRKIILLQTSMAFVFIIVFLKLFFQNRFIVELDLLLIPFAAYFLVYLVQKYLKKIYVKIVLGLFLIVISVFLSHWYYKTTFPALTVYEVWAIDVLNERTDSEYNMVINTLYAPWLYGFSNKITLAPGIFESVWDYDQWVKYISASEEECAQMLIDITEKYGKYYLFVGSREPHPAVEQKSDKIKKIFDVYGATIYEISP